MQSVSHVFFKYFSLLLAIYRSWRLAFSLRFHISSLAPPFAPLSALNRMDLVQGKLTLKRKKLIWLLVGTIKSMASGYPATLA